VVVVAVAALQQTVLRALLPVVPAAAALEQLMVQLALPEPARLVRPVKVLPEETVRRMLRLETAAAVVVPARLAEPQAVLVPVAVFQVLAVADIFLIFQVVFFITVAEVLVADGRPGLWRCLVLMVVAEVAKVTEFPEGLAKQTRAAAVVAEVAP
jgi:hypothetical protein